MRSALRGPAHQLAVPVRMRIILISMAIIIIAQSTSHAPYASNCACAEGLHFSALHYYGTREVEGLRTYNGGLRLSLTEDFQTCTNSHVFVGIARHASTVLD